MDYYKNIDKLCAEQKPVYTISGVQYFVDTDLEDEPVTVSFFKQHARIDYNTDDNIIENYLKAARQELEKWTQLSFGVKTMRMIALSVPNNYRLMFGKVDEILTSGYSNFGDILLNGGRNIDIKYTTLDWIDETIKIAICRYAAGLYLNREPYIDSGQFNSVEDQRRSGGNYINEAKLMLRPYMNVTLF